MNDAIASSTAKSYMDFSGLGELRGKAQRNDDPVSYTHLTLPTNREV